MSFRNYYDTSSYGRNRAESGRIGSTSDRPTTVTAKYIAPTFKTSSIPVLCRERSATRESETPISAIANRYASYKTNKDDKLKYGEKKDSTYSRLTVPGTSNSKSREPSPVKTSSKYSTSRSPRALSPDRRILKTPTLTKSRSRDPSPKDREKDIPNKTDKPSGYNSGYSTYKIYPRSSTYSRPISRTETKPEITLSRYGISNRLSSSYLRGNSIEKTQASSLSPSYSGEGDVKVESENIVTESLKNESVCIQMEDTKPHEIINNEEITEIFETITVITRHTSPTPPGSSVYVRTRRADMAKTVEKTITRSNKRPIMVDKHIQSDRLDDSTRNSRFSTSTRANVAAWSSYNPSSNRYCGYAGRYSTQYANVRDQSLSSNSASERTENSHNNISESINRENPVETSHSECKRNDVILVNNVNSDTKNSEPVTVCKENEDDETSEIIINVNLKLKKAKTNNSITSADMVSPEVTITNCHLPPQAPKMEAPSKIKKVKLKKSTTDMTGEPKKRIIKKRRGSTSSADSDQMSERNSVEKTSPTKEIPKKTLRRQSSSSTPDLNESALNVPNIIQHSSKSQTNRESNSPESIATTSTQTSCSDDDVGSKSKSIDLSRTSADDVSIPYDKSAKYSPQKMDSTNDEAKSFLIRALAPVTNFFKHKQHENSENSNWIESTSESTSKDIPNISTESTSAVYDQENKVTLRPIRHIESGERAWWLDSENNDKNKSGSQNSASDRNFQLRKIRHIDSGERAWWLDSSSDKYENPSSENKLTGAQKSVPPNSKYSKQDSEETPWWLDSNAKIPEGVERLSPARKTSSESERSEKFDFYKIRHIDSGEKEWWHTNNSEPTTHSNSKDFHDNSNLSKSGSKSNFPLKKIRHVESGERPWWLSNSNNVPEGVEKLPTPSPPPESDSSVSEEVQAYVMPSPQIPPFPLMLPGDEPLGARRSPEGLETPREDENYRHRRSPYENANYRNGLPQPGFRKSSNKFVSRYTDIDDIFGTSGQMYSPFMDSILARRTGQAQCDEDFSDCEEIDPTQVRIHDSTPQHPVIQKLRCRSEIIDCRDEDQLDDVALQVYKDSDYGVYLDLDATVGEQHEELEGLRDQSVFITFLTDFEKKNIQTNR